MANGYFERGEIYWVRYGDQIGSEEGAGRPGVIVSSEKGNATSSVVNVALVTKQRKYHSIDVQTCVNGVNRWVLCNQILTVDKSRLGRCEGKLSPQEMKCVEDALEEVFDLGYVDDAAIKAKDAEIADRDTLIGDLKTEVAAATAEIGKRDDEIASLRMEIEMWQKCYGRCMDMLVDTKVNADIKRRTVTPPPVKSVVDPEEPKLPVVLVDPPKQPEEPKLPEVEDNRLDINNCTATALKKIGFSIAMARKIVQSRPFKNLEDLKRVNGLKATQYKIMEPKLCCKPVVEKETPKVEFVKDVDPGYEVVEEPVVEVTEVEVAVETRKVNVNTAKAREIHEVSGIALSTCYCITKYRNDNGPYKKIEDLLNAKQVGAATLQRHGAFLEV